MRPLFNYLSIILILTSCTAAKVAVPAQFSSQATPLKVKGVNGFTINQSLTFGGYKTSRIKRGWDFSGGLQYTKFNLRPEEMVLQVFDIGTDKKTFNQRNKFQYTIADGNQVAEVFAQERFKAKELVYKSSVPAIGQVTRTDSYNYSFGAAIVPLTSGNTKPWSLVMTESYDRSTDTATGIFDRPFVETQGYATNGDETITIRQLMLRNVTTAKGKQMKVAGGPLLSGYELRIDNGVIAVVDILDNTLWVYNELDQPTRLVVASIASAILLKRLQDVDSDRSDALN